MHIHDKPGMVTVAQLARMTNHVAAATVTPQPRDGIHRRVYFKTGVIAAGYAAKLIAAGRTNVNVRPWCGGFRVGYTV